MKKIPLTQNKYALVDSDDYDFLNQWKWFYSNGYAVRYVTLNKEDGGKKNKIIWMHRVINQTPDGMHTDHINNNRADNRKINLRSCTVSQNRRNVKKTARGKSEYKGIFSCPNGKWRACLTITENGKRKSIYFGTHDSQEKAAMAYDDGAIKYFGEFANLNFKKAA